MKMRTPGMRTKEEMDTWMARFKKYQQQILQEFTEEEAKMIDREVIDSVAITEAEFGDFSVPDWEIDLLYQSSSGKISTYDAMAITVKKLGGDPAYLWEKNPFIDEWDKTKTTPWNSKQICNNLKKKYGIKKSGDEEYLVDGGYRKII